MPAGEPPTNAASLRGGRPATGSAGTKGFLFCDLRGYTAFVEAKGDAAAAELLEKYRGLVREVIAAHEGAEIKTEGDSVYVVFPTASAAVDAGLGIVAAAAEASTRERPIRVGVGIHAGETVATTEGLVGGAVNIAARVCVKAKAGEVLVTDTVRALTRTFLPYAYTALGPQSLKGIAGGIPLYRVEAVPASRVSTVRRRLVARRRRVALVASIVALVLVVTTAAWAVNRPPDCLSLPASTKDVVAKIDPARNCVVATYPVGRGPSAALWAHDALWVGNVDDWTVTAIGADGHRRATVGTGPITAMAADDSWLWVLSGGPTGLQRTPAVTRVILDTAAPSAVDLPGLLDILPKEEAAKAQSAGVDWSPEYGGMLAQPGRLWLSERQFGLLVRLPTRDDGIPITGTFDAGVNIDPAPDLGALVPGWSIWPPPGSRPLPQTTLIQAVGSTVWAGHGASPDLTVYDTVSGSTRHVPVPGVVGGATGLSTTGAELLVSFHGGQVARVGLPSDAVPMTVADVGSILDGVAGDAAGVWAVSLDDRAVFRLDPTSLATRQRIGVGGMASAVAIAPDGTVWVTIK